MDKFLIHFSNFIFRNYFILVIFIFKFISCSFDSHSIIEGKYPKAILLPSEKYLIILEKGIYLYNYDFSLNKSIYNFTTYEIIYYDYSRNIQIEVMKVNNTNFITILTKSKYIYI